MTTSARTPTLAEVVNRGLQLLSQQLYSIRVGRIEKFDASKGLADVQPLQQEIREIDGGEEVYTIAVIPNVPVICLGGGDYADTYPVAQGDECLLLVSDRSVDAWFDQGGVVDPVDVRRHNLTDAFALVGLRSKSRALSEWPTDRREIGKQGGPRVSVTDSRVNLGVDSGEDATDAVALEPATKKELKALHDKLQDFINTFAEHTHFVSTAGPPLAHTGTTEPTTSLGPTLDPVGDIAATKVFGK